MGADPIGLPGRWGRATAAAQTAIVAHRGAWGAAAENTLEAFEAAIQLGADMIEFDVRRTGDGRLVVQHDPSADGLPLAGVRHPALAGSHARPPRLEEVLELARDRVSIDIELKERGCVAHVVPLLRGFGLGRCLLTSFYDDVVRAAKELEPALRTGLLIGRHRRLSELAPAGRLRRAGADVLVVHQRLAAAGALRRVRLPCLVWTVNGLPQIERALADARVSGVITDHPGIALAARARLSARTARAAPSSERRQPRPDCACADGTEPRGAA